MNITQLRSFGGTDCDTDHYLLVEKFRERLAESKQTALNCDVERLNLWKLSELEVRKKYQIEIPNRFAAFENLTDSNKINKAWENIKQNIKTSDKDSLGL